MKGGKWVAAGIGLLLSAGAAGLLGGASGLVSAQTTPVVNSGTVLPSADSSAVDAGSATGTAASGSGGTVGVQEDGPQNSTDQVDQAASGATATGAPDTDQVQVEQQGGSQDQQTDQSVAGGADQSETSVAAAADTDNVQLQQ